MNPTTPAGNGSSPDDLSFEILFFENLSRRDPKDVRVLEVLAHHYTKNGRITDGLRIDRRIVRHDPENPLAHYNLACSLALKKRKKEAVESLSDAVERGYGDVDWMLRDDDLACLREYTPFLQLVKRVAHESETGGR